MDRKALIVSTLSLVLSGIIIATAILAQSSGGIYFYQSGSSVYIKWFNYTYYKTLLVLNLSGVYLPKETYYNGMELDKAIDMEIARFAASKSYVDTNVLGNKSEVITYIDNAVTELKNEFDENFSKFVNLLMSYLNTSFADLRKYVDTNVEGNVSKLASMIAELYYNKTLVDQLILGNVSEVMSWAEKEFYPRQSVDSLILGNVSALRLWVEQNFYNKSVVDSWDLIKYYTLEKDLNANGHAILNVSELGIGTASPRANLEVVGTLMVCTPSGRYFKMFFGADNDLEFNGSAMIIHPAWSSYNPSGLVYFSNNPSYIKVGIGTDNPQYRLDVAGDIRAIGASVLADYFSITEGGKPTGWHFDYFPDNARVSILANNTPVMSWLPNGYVGIGTTNPQYMLDVAGSIRANAVYTDYLRLTEGGRWGSISSTSSGWEIDYYPDGSMVFRYTNDNGATYHEVAKIYPYGLATHYAINKDFLSKLSGIRIYSVLTSDGSTTTILNISWHGVVIVSITTDWADFDSMTIYLDGASKTIPISVSSYYYYATITLTFVVDNSLAISLHNVLNGYDMAVQLQVIEVNP